MRCGWARGNRKYVNTDTGTRSDSIIRKMLNKTDIGRSVHVVVSDLKVFEVFIRQNS